MVRVLWKRQGGQTQRVHSRKLEQLHVGCLLAQYWQVVLINVVAQNERSSLHHFIQRLQGGLWITRYLLLQLGPRIRAEPRQMYDLVKLFLIIRRTFKIKNQGPGQQCHTISLLTASNRKPFDLPLQACLLLGRSQWLDALNFITNGHIGTPQIDCLLGV